MASPLKTLIIQITIIAAIVGFRLPAGKAGLSVIGYCAENNNYIRVAIVRDTDSLGLSVRGFYKITDSNTHKILASGKHLKTTVIPAKEGILVGGVNYNVNKLFIEADDPQAIAINNRKFRGNVEVVKKENLHLLVVNHIELEAYVKGILYHEVSHYWPREALEAQAIVCRTYAVYQMGQGALKDYDVTSDIYSQVYGGKASERYRTNKAVIGTQGKILKYRGKVFPAYFHATCAGHTEDASLLWNIDIAALKGVACGFCKDSPHFNWHYVSSLKQIKEALQKSGYKECANISAMVILGRDASGRITDLKIETGNNKEIKISAKDFRNIVGPNLLRSTNFAVDIAGLDAVFSGFGWGHGVGMCQWGAYFMAKQGYTAEQILKYYYPQSDVTFI